MSQVDIPTISTAAATATTTVVNVAGSAGALSAEQTYQLQQATATANTMVSDAQGDQRPTDAAFENTIGGLGQLTAVTAVVSQLIPDKKVAEAFQKAAAYAGLAMLLLQAVKVLFDYLQPRSSPKPNVNGQQNNNTKPVPDFKNGDKNPGMTQTLVPEAPKSIATTSTPTHTQPIIAEIIVKHNNTTTTIINFTSLHICEKYGDHLEVELILPSKNMEDQKEYITLAEARKYLGQPAEIKIGQLKKQDKNKSTIEIDDDSTNDQKPREFNFIITDISTQFYPGYGVQIVCKGFSTTYILKQAINFETYNDTLDNIMNAVSAPCQKNQGNATAIKTNSTIKDTIYACRFGESAFNFMRRLANTYAQYFYYDGKQLVFGALANTKKTTLTYGSGGIGHCNNLHMSTKVHSAHTSTFYYNDETDNLLTAQAPTNEDEIGKMGWLGTQAFAQAHQLCTGISNVPSLISMASQPILEKNTNAYAAGQAAAMYSLSFDSTDYTLSLCQQVTIKYPQEPGKPFEQSDIRITAINHHIEGNNGIYTNYAHGIPAGLNYPPPLPNYMPITYPVLAKVIDNKGLNGKVQVEFIGWKSQQNELCKTNFIRVASPDAGSSDKVLKNRGFKFIPEIGDQVLVNFYEGVPEKAYVQCSMYAGPKTTGVVENNDIKSIITKSGCTIEFNDSKTSITVKDSKGAQIVLNGDGTLTISATEKIDIQSKVVNITGEDKVNVNGLNIDITAAPTKAPFTKLGNIKINAAGGKLEASGTAGAKLSSDNVAKLEAASVAITGSAKVDVEAPIVSITGKITTNVKGGTLNLNP